MTFPILNRDMLFLCRVGVGLARHVCKYVATVYSRHKIVDTGVVGTGLMETRTACTMNNQTDRRENLTCDMFKANVSDMLNEQIGGSCCRHRTSKAITYYTLLFTCSFDLALHT